MKKLINIVLSSIFIVMQVTVEFYPAIKKAAVVYANNLDFDSLLQSEHITDYVSFLSEEEKIDLERMISSYIKNTMD